MLKNLRKDTAFCATLQACAKQNVPLPPVFLAQESGLPISVGIAPRFSGEGEETSDAS